MLELIPVNDRYRTTGGIMNGTYTYLTMQNAWLAGGYGCIATSVKGIR